MSYQFTYFIMYSLYADEESKSRKKKEHKVDFFLLVFISVLTFLFYHLAPLHSSVYFLLYLFILFQSALSQDILSLQYKLIYKVPKSTHVNFIVASAGSPSLFFFSLHCRSVPPFVSLNRSLM